MPYPGTEPAVWQRPSATTALQGDIALPETIVGANNDM